MATDPNQLPLGGVHPRTQAIVLYLSGIFFMSVMDAGAKWLAPTYAIVQLIFFEGIFGIVPAALFLNSEGWTSLLTRKWHLLVARACLTVATMSFFFLALRFLPLAEVTVICMLAPLLAALFSAALLGEKLDARCHVAIATGLGGTLLLIRPTGAHFELAMLLPFGAAVSYALSLNLSRALSRSESTAAIVMYDYAVVLAASGLLLPAYWITPEFVDWPVFAIMGLCGGLSLYYRVKACRHAPVKTLAPLDYTGIGWAILLGYVLWQESPDLWGYVGIALIGGSAIFVLRQKPEQAGAAAA